MKNPRGDGAWNLEKRDEKCKADRSGRLSCVLAHSPRRFPDPVLGPVSQCCLSALLRC